MQGMNPTHVQVTFQEFQSRLPAAKSRPVYQRVRLNVEGMAVVV
jgi:hypothetical protein